MLRMEPYLLAMISQFTMGIFAIETTNAPVVCSGPYVLCSTALCAPIPGNSSYVSCACEGPYNGPNIGLTTCADREKYDISSFAFGDTLEQIYVFPCQAENAGPWAQCNGALCTVDGGNATCACPLEVGDHLYYGDECPTTGEGVQEACAMLRSTTDLFTQSNATTMDDAVGSRLEEVPLSLSFCQLPSNSSG